jgi:hypothetical protein
MKQVALNSRQWRLYGYLKDHHQEYVTQEKIYFDLNIYPEMFNEANPFHDSAARLQITNDIRAINKSDVIQKIIISNSNGVKIATPEEFDQSFLARTCALKAAIGRQYKLHKKAELNNQTRITFGSGRSYVEAFMPDTAEDAPQG